MTVPVTTDKNDGWPLNALLAALIGAFAPACYTRSWVPWLRWVGAGCVVVVLVVVLHLVVGVPGVLIPGLP